MKKARRIWSHMWFLWNQCIFIYIFHIWNYYILYLTQVNYYMSNLQKKWMEMVRNSWNRTVSAIVTLVTVWPHVTGSGGYRELFNSNLIHFGTPCDAWRVWRSFGFGNLPNSPWHLEIFRSFAPQAAKKNYIWEPDHKMISAPYKNCRDQRDISAIWKAPWRVTAELN